MATRRSAVAAQGNDAATVEYEKTHRTPYDGDEDSSAALYKLLAFTVLMVCAPLGVYFGTVNRVFEGNSTYAGAYAAVTANLVVLGYILMAIWEDSGAEKSRKGDVVKGKEE
ncbi:hypothetical protein PABG_01569 [Paracoccidioides brasiliensis Pb03]|uniref:Uncharacterized protein n=1 Tax=Paracoccidioides brasiliensis TaxID=121759 RepID=A0A1D2JCK2_PARBR|nr:hypothetical protein PABG_01569 [Paracoccidioides brasiliensis Pb03]ODH26350.1 hypothetical protein ACO22_04678 [Paracoccidioides brasiliensis]ODH46145.1 hypothetical protein GX48_07751 [Paracoccidioides brasiliensis]